MVKNNKHLKRLKTYNTMNKLTLFFLLLLVLNVNLVFSLGDIGIIEQNKCISLYNYCPTCSYINVTAIQYPEGKVSTVDYSMTKTGNNYNYSFCDTLTLGDYSYTTCGDKAGVETCEDITFQVTPSGRGGNDNIALVIILILIIYIVTFVCFFGKNVPLSVLSGMFMTFFGVWIVQNGIVIYRDNLTNYFGYVTIAIGAMIALWAGIEWIEDVFE